MSREYWVVLGNIRMSDYRGIVDYGSRQVSLYMLATAKKQVYSKSGAYIYTKPRVWCRFLKQICTKCDRDYNL